MASLAEILAARVLEVKKSVRKSDSLRACASQHFLDTCAAVMVGLKVGTYQALMESTERSHGTVGIPGARGKWSEMDAGAIVAYQVNSSVYEDGSRYGACHPAAAVFPVLWALGQGARLIELMEAMAGGYEAMVCVASLGNPLFTQRGFHPTGLCGPFGAAAAAGILLKFDEKTMARALTLAPSGSCGLMDAFKEETTQPLHVSHGVRAGLIAAFMAQQGWAGEKKILEEGFYPAFLGGPPPGNNDQHFGTGWAIENAYLKPYPGCRHLHPALDAMGQILREHVLRPEDVASINVETYRVAIDTEIHPVRSRGDAYFNAAYALSVRVILGRADWDAFDVKYLEHPGVRELMARIVLSLDGAIDKAYPRERGARVHVAMKNGERFEAFQPLPRGEPELPLSFDETAEKFRQEAARYLVKKEVEGVIARVREARGKGNEVFKVFAGPFPRRKKG